MQRRDSRNPDPVGVTNRLSTTNLIGADIRGLDNPVHIAFLLVILLLIFGAKRLPEMGRSLGSGLRGFKEAISGESGLTTRRTDRRSLPNRSSTTPRPPDGARDATRRERFSTTLEGRNRGHTSGRLRAVEHDERLSTVDHLEELRSRLILALVAIAAAFSVCFWQNHRLLRLVDALLFEVSVLVAAV